MAASTDAPLAHRRGDAGFTLVEVLVAMVILAIGLLGIEAMAIGASRQIAMANRTTQYTLLGSQEIEAALTQARAGAAPQARRFSLSNGAVVDVAPAAELQPDNSRLWTVTVTVTPPTSSHLRLSPITVIGRALSPPP